MANINKIRLSGTTYSIQDLNATKTVELTQAEYDALSVKDPNTFYIITDATAGDLSNYYTKTETDGLLDTKLDATAYTPTDLSNYYTKSETSGATEISTALESKADTATTYTKTETDNAITAATSTKQDTLVSGTNIKTINNQSILGEGNITIEGGGSSYTAGDGIDINNDVISVTGKVDTSTYNTYTAATDTSLASKQTTLTAGTGISIVDNVISATGGGGGGGESCTVDSTAMFYIFNHEYSNYGLDMRVRYVVLDYGQHKTDTPNVSINVNFRDANYMTFVSKNINLDYSTSSYTFGDISQAEYIDVTYDSTIEDFKIAVATAYTSTVFIDYVKFSVGKIKVPFYTISSGSPCTAIENDIPTAISELGNIMIKGLKEVKISSQQNAIYVYNEKLDGTSSKRKIKLDEIDGSSSTLKPDIYVGLGTSGWTEINFSDMCIINSLKGTKYKVTYNNSELDSYSMGLQLTVEYGENESNDSVVFDETKQPSLQTQDVFSAATLDWNASTRELVITYPETVELNGNQESVNISQIISNGCIFGNDMAKLESYGEAKQALKSYVKETRAALSGKQDALVSGTNIKTINNESILGEGNITIQGGGSSINVVQTTGASTTDVMSQDAVTTQLNGKGDAIGIDMVGSPKKKVTFQMRRGGVNGTIISSRDLTLGRGLVYGEEGFDTLSTSGLVETSAITTSVTSSSTDAQVPSAKAVYDMVGNINTILENI